MTKPLCSILVALITLVPLAARGADAPAQQQSPRLLNDKTLPVIAAPSFKEPLDATWSVRKGKWTPEDGVLRVVEVPEDKHVPVLHHLVGLTAAVIDCEFRLESGSSFLVGCDSANHHVGRVVVRADSMSIAEDSAKASHTLASVKTVVKAGEWHRLHVEWKGDQMAASLDGQELRAQHEFLATAKARSWLAVGKSAAVRNLTIAGEKGDASAEKQPGAANPK